MSSSAHGFRTRPGRQTRSSAAGGKEHNGQKREGYDRDDDEEPVNPTPVVLDLPFQKTYYSILTFSPAVETLLCLVSSSDLKEICAKVLEDETGVAKLREELLSCTEDILARSRAEAREESLAITYEARQRLYDFTKTTRKECKSMCEIEDWAAQSSPLFHRIKDLHNRGPLAEGPEMAWRALLKVTALCIHKWEGAELRFSGFGEEDCDQFHERADALMLLICESQKENGKTWWLSDGRKEEILRLQQKAEENEGKPFPYRYECALEFLEQL
ncbi:hypothetical protein GGR55DRAFT_676877 [Xylaria sp. FL0064]|nr:hypothetical protein GGR55DRAFT_676877 [Xylaria sp. FL0064]